jgi:hypothetical protein
MAKKKDDNPKKEQKKVEMEIQKTKSSKKELPKIDQLLVLLKKGDRDEKELSQLLKIDLHTLYDIAEELARKGHDVRIYNSGDKKIFSLSKSESVIKEAIPITHVNKKFKIGIISEIRMGSKQAQISLLHWIYKEVFEREDIDFVIVVGGLVIGKPTPTLVPDILRPDLSPDELVNYVIKHFPQSKKFKTYIVSGRAELSWKTKDGFDIVSAICKERVDLSSAGDLERTFDVKGVRIKVMNPYDDNCPKGVSYGPQKIADNLRDSPMPHILVLGGIHRRARIPVYNDMFIEIVPSLHMQMRRQARRGLSPRIGFTILNLNYNSDWSIDHGKGGLVVSQFDMFNYKKQNDCLDVNFKAVEKLNEEERKVANWFIDEFVIRHGEIARRLGKNKEYVLEIIKKLRKYGYAIEFKEDSKSFELEVREKTKFAPLPIKYEDVFVWATKEAGISDPHLNSKEECWEILNKAYEDAAKAGARRVLNAGDVTDGGGSVGYRGHQFDVKYMALDDADDYIISKWPQIKIKIDPQKPRLLITEMYNTPEGKIAYREKFPKEGEVWLQTDVIEGNHDGWAYQTIGRKTVRALAIRLPHIFRYVGYLEGCSIFDGIYHKLIHPKCGSGYTYSFIVERFLKAVRESGENKGLPTIVYIGHYHSAFMLFDRRIGIRMPGVKKADKHIKTLGFASKPGMFITEIFLDKTGKKITRINSDYRDYTYLLIELESKQIGL